MILTFCCIVDLCRKLKTMINEVYMLVRDKFQEQTTAILEQCTATDMKDVESNGKLDLKHWDSLVLKLDDLHQACFAACVPEVMTRHLFAQCLEHINAKLVNIVLVCEECCTITFGKHLFRGLQRIEHWFADDLDFSKADSTVLLANGVWLRDVWSEELLNIRQVLHSSMNVYTDQLMVYS